jgi:hypothetical protein
MNKKEFAQVRADTLAKGFYPGEDVVDIALQEAFYAGYMRRFRDEEIAEIVREDLRREGLEI